MHVWTVQPEKLYEKLKTEKVLHCDPAQSEWVTECGFGPAYDWISEQMKVRVGPPPKGVIYPSGRGIQLTGDTKDLICAARNFAHTRVIRFVWR